MTVQSDLKKAAASAQSLLGSYATFAESTDDQSAKQMFNSLAQDMKKHVNTINSRLNYLESNNPMYQKQQQQQNKQQ
jgi:rubrerythrin